jgi:hypothetical protein
VVDEGLAGGLGDAGADRWLLGEELGLAYVMAMVVQQFPLCTLMGDGRRRGRWRPRASQN